MRVKLSPILLFLFMLYGCKKERIITTAPQDEALYSVNDLNKYIIENNCTVFAVGFNDVLSDPAFKFNPKNFSRFFTHRALFFDDKSGSIVVEGTDGITISDPFNKSREGRSNKNDMDADSNKIVPVWMDIINGSGSGFYQFNRINPKSGSVEKYTSFVQSVTIASAYFHSGFFVAEQKQLYTLNEMNEQLVKHAVIALAVGMGGLFDGFSLDSLKEVSLMRKFMDNIRFFDNRSGYFYVLDLNGVNLVQPPDHSVQGTNRYDLQDSRGTYLVRGLIEVAKGGGGFYTYYYNNPATNKEEMKKAYVQLIPGTSYFVGAGVYFN